jgi:hypothetical protein
VNFSQAKNQKIYHTIGTVFKFNRKIVERSNIETHLHVHDLSRAL